MNRHLIKFQQLLRELFQFDCADLDFGIYRIMNRKRDMIERFITLGTVVGNTEHLCFARQLYGSVSGLPGKGRGGNRRRG